jgi:formylglycine-generating enzyme required for sulfatase activity
MVMMFVPSGEFTMGYQEIIQSNEQNKKMQQIAHVVSLDNYWIDKTEITNDMFAKFVNATNYVTEVENFGSGYVAMPIVYWQKVDGASWKHPRGPNTDLINLGNHPVVQVTWKDASEYCKWAGRRLPTEAEWEKAARGDDMRKYPWGNNDWTGEQANMTDNNFYEYIQFKEMTSDKNDGYSFSAPIGSYPKGASPYGILDMAGNVWEWVSDWYGEGYYLSAPKHNPLGPSTGEVHIIRGMSWDIDYGEAAINRQINFPDGRSASLGFRCASSE